MHTSTSSEPTIYSVAQLNSLARQLLTEEFTDIRVNGEISNLSTPSSGHLYFSLKDSLAQIRCAMFRTRMQRNTPKLTNGMQVTLRGQVSLYEPRGDYQLIVNAIEADGTGALQRNFELLKQKLAAQGLFDASHKKAIPSLPKCIGVITSPSGAAIRDVLSVLKRRFPAIPIIIYPTAVQGEAAKHEIVQAITLANQHPQCDVLLLCRGGGSLEDLWAFNEELVANAIFSSSLPIISGIGHEIDFTIADFVVDLRAPTPSAAAEHAVPSQEHWLHQLQQVETRLIQQLQRKLHATQQQLNWLDKRLQSQHPKQQLLRHAQTLDQLELRLHHSWQSLFQRQQHQLNQLQAKLWQHSPTAKLQQYQQQQRFLHQRLQRSMHQSLQVRQQQLLRYSQTLHALSPLATLERGYAIVRRVDDQHVITQRQQLQVGTLIHTRFAQGSIISRVEDLDT